MRTRPAEILLTILGTLLVLAAAGFRLVIFVHLGFSLIRPVRGDQMVFQFLVIPLLLLAASAACATGAWAVRRVIKRMDADLKTAKGFEVLPPRE